MSLLHRPLAALAVALFAPAAFSQAPGVTATNGLLSTTTATPEEHVLLSWPSTGVAGQVYQINRARVVNGVPQTTQVLAVQPEAAREYKDATALPGVQYEYCLPAFGTGGAACARGARVLRRPLLLAASDSTRIDGVKLEWADRSTVEVGFVVFRGAVGAPRAALTAIDTTTADATVFLDPDAPSLQALQYCVGLLDRSGGTPVVSEPLACDIGTRGAVLPPAGVAASDGTLTDRVRVVWTYQPGVTYSVYRSAPGAARQQLAAGLAPTAAVGATYDDAGAAGGTDYKYCVTASAAGTESVANCDNGRRGGLAPPTDMVAQDGTSDTGVDMTWTDPGTSETGFYIFRAAASGEGDVRVAVLPANRTRYTDTSARPGVTYTYCVAAVAEAAVDGAVTSSVSARSCDEGSSVGVLPPTAFAATDSTRETDTELTWTSAGGAVQIFQILRDGQPIASLAPFARKHNDPTGLSGTTYSYAVRAIAVAASDPATVMQGFEPLLSRAAAVRDGLAAERVQADDAEEIARINARTADVEATLVRDLQNVLSGLGVSASMLADDPCGVAGVFCASTPVDTGSRLLKAPGSLVATTTLEDRVKLTWADRSAIETDYEVRVELPELNDPSPRTVLVGPNRTDWIDLESPAGTPVHYRVRAIDRDLSTPESASVWATATGHRALLPPGQVAARQATAENELLVTWRDSSRAEAGYRLGASVSAGFTADVPANARQFVVPLGPDDFGRPVTVTVRPFDANTDPTFQTSSNTVSVTVTPTLLAPRVVTASTGYANRVVVSWTDDSQADTGYRITRNGSPLGSDDGNGTYTDASPIGAASYCVTTVNSGPDTGWSRPVCATGGTSVTTAPNTGAVVVSPVVASDLSNHDGTASGYGAAVAAQGGTAVVGALDDGMVLDRGEAPDWSIPWMSGNTVPTGGGYQRFFMPEIGLASVYARTADGWTDAARLQIQPSDGFTYGLFGASVDVEGDVALIGAPGPAVFVGHPVYGATGAPGNWVAQTSHEYNDGGAYIYRRGQDGTWAREALLRGNGRPDNQYTDVLFRPEEFDATHDVQGRSRRFVREYVRDENGVGRLTVDKVDTYASPIREVGRQVALAPGWAFTTWRDFETGGWHIGSFQQSQSWAYKGTVEAPDGYTSTSGQMAATPGMLAVSAFLSPVQSGTQGLVNLYQITASGLASAGGNVRLPDSAGSEFGAGLDIRGTLLAVGAPGSTKNAVYLYRQQPSAGVYTWPLEATLVPQAGDTRFGQSVSISNGFVAVGAKDASGQGVMYTFRTQTQGGGATWVQASRLTQGSPRAEDQFGAAVAAIGDDLVIGAPGVITGGLKTGAVYFATVGVTPTAVAASDGRYANRVQVKWKDQASSETGYRVYRQGPGDTSYALVGTTAPNFEVFDDFDIAPGAAYSYCVASFLGDDESVTNPLGESGRVCDAGWTPPNGTVSGRLATTEGGNVVGSQVCLAPGPDQAVNFDGLGGYAVVPDFGAMPSSFTLEAWVNADAFPLEDVLIAGVSVGGSAKIRLDREGRVLAEVTAGAATGAIRSSAPITTGAWHHLAMSFDGAGGQYRLYVDGAEVATYTTTGALRANGPFEIGFTAGGIPSHFDGRIDEVRVWNRARTASEIASASRTPLRGDEANLYAYWPIEQGSGRILPDLTRAGRNATLEGGTGWTAQAAPLDVCAVTDADGNYTFPGVRYGETTAFRVVPTDSTRQFTPAAKTATLTPQSPTQNQLDFQDTSSYTVRGRVVHAVDQSAWPGQASIAAAGVEVYVDAALAGTTAADGTFAVAVRGAGRHVVEARSTGLSFTAALGTETFATGKVEREIRGDLDGLTFTNTTQRTLRGRAAGGCARPLGALTFRITTEDRRFNQTFTTADSQPYALTLPPLPYRLEYVDIGTVPSPLSRTRVVEYFRNLGVLRADLAAAEADTVDFRYRAPIRLAIAGLDSPAPTCATSGYTVVDADGVPRKTIPGVPVIAEYARVPLSIRAYEDYGAGGQCPVDAATVRIFDGFADAVATPVEVALTNGQAAYTTFGRSPDTFAGRTVDGVDRSYQKSLTAVLEVPDGPSVTETLWAVVEGYREKPATFVTATMSEMPLMVLRDPPGTESFAYAEKGTSSCVALSQINATSAAGGVAVDLQIGFKVTTGFLAMTDNGAGVHFSTETLVGGGAEQTTGDRNSNMTVCATTDERLETRGDTGWSGEDLYTGVGLNLVFAEADVVTAGNACTVRLSTTLATDVDQAKPFETTFVYGVTHINNTLIPSLETLARLSGETTTIAGQVDGTDASIPIRKAIDNWHGMVAANDSLVTSALSGAPENRSFSGGTTYSYGTAQDTTWTSSYASNAFYSSDNRGGGIFTILGYDSIIDAVIQVESETTFGRETENTESFGAGYTFSDSDAGDAFTVNVAQDPRYGTYVFRTVSGASSNPWEAGTQKRDNPRIAIDPPLVDGVLDGQSAVYTLLLTNASESNERREYVLDAPPHLNPQGATIRVNGAPLSEKRVLVEPNQTISIPVTVERGPRDTDYEMAIIAYSPFDHAIWRTAPQFSLVTSDTVRFEAKFTPLVAPVRLAEPVDGWAVSRSDPSVRLTLGGITVQRRSEEGLGVEYRRPGGEWTNAVSFTGDQFTASTDTTLIWTPPADAVDGAYEFRAYARRAVPDAPPGFDGPTVPGWIDRTAPLPFGLPQPAGGVLALGETIGLAFEEPVDCVRLRRDIADGSALAELLSGTGAPVSVTVGCAERTVLLAPSSASLWADIEGQFATARVRGIRDLRGNPMAALPGADAGWDASWRFTVRRNGFGWTPALVAATAQSGAPADIPAALVNGRAQPVTFDLIKHNATGLPFSFVPVDPSTGATLPGGTPVRVTMSALAGTVASGDVLPVVLRWPGAPDGTYHADIEVHSTEAGQDLGRTTLGVTVVVACKAPAWVTNAAAFEQSMLVTADLKFAGVTSDDPNDRLAAFIGGELRGDGAPRAYSTPGGTVWRVPISVYGTGAAQWVTFEAWDQSACTLHRTTSQVVKFASNGALGTVPAPLVIEAPGAGGAPLSVPLAQGWTWASSNREAAPTLATSLVGVGAAATDVVQGRDGFSSFVPGTGWQGQVSGITPGRAYQIKLAWPAVMTQPGVPINPTTPVPLVAGWNWIGYLPQTPLSVSEALAAVAFANDDQIKAPSQGLYAQYVAGVGWRGSLKSLSAGVGYQLRTAKDATLTYPGAAAQSAARVVGSEPSDSAFAVRRLDTLPDVTEAGPRQNLALPDDISVALAAPAALSATSDWSASEAARSFEHSMTVTASVDGGSGGEYVAAYAVSNSGDELRGVASVEAVEGIQGTRAFLLVHGTGGEVLVLRAVQDDGAGGWTPVNDLMVTGRTETLVFERDAVLGTVAVPVEVQASGAMAAEPDMPTEVGLSPARPNPSSAGTTFGFGLPTPAAVRLVVHDVLGREVAVVIDTDMPAGFHTARIDGLTLAPGTYVARLVTPEAVRVRTFTIVR